MAVTYRLRKQAVPYKTRLTGRLMLLTKAFSKKTRLKENEGFGVTCRTPRHFRTASQPLATIRFGLPRPNLGARETARYALMR